MGRVSFAGDLRAKKAYACTSHLYRAFVFDNQVSWRGGQVLLLMRAMKHGFDELHLVSISW